MPFQGQFLGQYLGQTLGQDLCPSQGALIPLSQSTFVCSSADRYGLLGGRVYGPVGAGVMLKRNYKGTEYTLIQRENTNKKKGSQSVENATYWPWSNNVTKTADQIVSPLGTLTADKVVETADAGVFRQVGEDGPAIGAPFTWACFVKPLSVGDPRLVASNPTGVNERSYYNISTGIWVDKHVNHSNHFVIDCINGWKYIGHTAALLEYWLFKISPVPYVTDSYDGDGVSGLYAWQAYVNNGYYPLSPIVTGGSAVTQLKQVVSFEMALANARKVTEGKFRLKLIPSYSSDQLAACADGYKCILASWPCATSYVQIGFERSGANTQFYIYYDGNKLTVTTATATWTMYDELTIDIDVNNGANSVATFTGFATGDGAHTGTAIAADLTATGDVYLGCDYDGTDNQVDGWLSSVLPLGG